MLEAIIENNHILNKFLSEFWSAFQNKAQFRHFQHYVIALMIYLGEKNLSGLSRAIPDGRKQCTRYRLFRFQRLHITIRCLNCGISTENEKAHSILNELHHDYRRTG